MDIKELLRLVSEVAEGKGNIEKGAVGSNGYGFIFIDPNSDLPYVIKAHSSKFAAAGAWRNFVKNFRKNHQYLKSSRDLDSLYEHDRQYDLLFAGALKTLVPTLQFGGYELLFDVWMFVKTPKNRYFPATFYYGQSGTSVGGWDPGNIDSITHEKVFPDDFYKIVNFSPFEFTKEDLNLFLDALEFALMKIPISDFWGVYNHDLGNLLMGIRNGKPFIKELERFWYNSGDEKKIESFLGKTLKSADGEAVKIIQLSGRPIYQIIYENDSNLYFGGASEALEMLEDSFPRTFFQKYIFKDAYYNISSKNHNT